MESTTTTTASTNDCGSNNVNSTCGDNNHNHVKKDNIVEIIKHLPRDCIHCDGPDCQVRNPRHRCSRCYCNYYCSTVCQKKDWKNHKPYCISLDEMKKKHDGSKTSNDHRSSNNNDDIILEMKQLELDTQHQEERKDKDMECAICFEKPMKNPIYLKECSHGFCSSCIIQWQQYRKLMADLIVDFHEDDDTTAVSVKRNTLNCPYCRTETVDDIEENLMKQAMLLATRASTDTVKANRESRQTLLKESLSYLDQVLATEVPIISAYFTKAEILLELQEPEQSLIAIELLMKVDEERKKHPVNQLMEEQDHTVIDGNRVRYEELKEEIVLAAEKYGMPATRLRPDAYYHTYCLQIQAYEALHRWDDAFATYKKAGLCMEESFAATTPPQQRQFYYGLGKCLYELHQYEHCIEMLNAAIEMNRHYPGVHKYKALAQQQLHYLDDAIITMNRASLYETPWDEENQNECYHLYKQLVSLSKEQQDEGKQE